MNRRDFLKLAGLLFPALMLKPEIPTMATNGNLLARALRGEKLLESEIVQLEQAIDSHDLYARILQSHTELGSPILKIPQTFNKIFSETLTADAATLEIPIPAIYKHLLIFGGGRTNGAGAGSDFLLYRFNGDDSTNYLNQKLYGNNVTVTAARDTSQQQGIIGILAQGGYTAGAQGGFYCFIPNYNSPDTFKSSLAIVIAPGGYIAGYASTWDVVDPVRYLEFRSGTDDIAAGSVFSVYGID